MVHTYFDRFYEYPFYAKMVCRVCIETSPSSFLHRREKRQYNEFTEFATETTRSTAKSIQSAFVVSAMKYSQYCVVDHQLASAND